MTTTQQYTKLMAAIRDVGKRVDRVEQRLAYEFPTNAEAAAQVHAELDEILAQAATETGVRVFE